MTGLFFVLGLASLFAGGHWLVGGASTLALRLRLSPFVIGLTVVAFGTSTPELLVSVDAALGGSGGIAIGNVLGSNIANILLILGVTAAIGAVSVRWAEVRRDAVWMGAAALVTLPLLWDGTISRLEGGLLIVLLAGYLTDCLSRPDTGDAPEIASLPLWQSLGLTVIGLVALMIGARLLVDSATEIARTFGVSEAAIGLTIVAVGTSLPELATSVVAAFRGAREIAVGNVIGSNIFNVLAILGVTAVITPIPANPRFLAIDAPVTIAVTALLILALWRGGLARWAGAGLLALYAVYLAGMALV